MEKESLFKEARASITFGVFTEKSQEDKESKSFPVHLDPVIATFGSKDRNEFGGTVCGGFVGMIITLNNGTVYRITTQQFVDFVAELEGQ